MKFVFVLIATLALGYGALATPLVKQPKDLNDDLAEFIDLLPLDEMLLVLLNYLGDPEVQNVIVYLFSEEFKQLVIEVEAIPEYNDVINFIEQAGLPIKSWIQALHDFLGISRKSLTTKTGGLKGLVDELLALIDVDELEKFYNHKMETSPDFRNLMEQITSEEFQGFVAALKDNKQIQEISAKLKEAGLDIEGLLQTIRDFFGLN